MKYLMSLTAVFLVTIFESPGVFPIPNHVKSSCVRYFASSSLRTEERLTSSIAYSQLNPQSLKNLTSSLLTRAMASVSACDWCG